MQNIFCRVCAILKQNIGLLQAKVQRIKTSRTFRRQLKSFNTDLYV